MPPTSDRPTVAEIEAARKAFHEARIRRLDQSTSLSRAEANKAERAYDEIFKKVPSALALLRQMETERAASEARERDQQEENAKLRRALDQAIKGYPRLADKPYPKGHYDDVSVQPESDEDYEYRIQRTFPYGENTVLFIGGDECEYPENCPELASYLREQGVQEAPNAG